MQIGTIRPSEMVAALLLYLPKWFSLRQDQPFDPRVLFFDGTDAAFHGRCLAWMSFFASSRSFCADFFIQSSSLPLFTSVCHFSCCSSFVIGTSQLFKEVKLGIVLQMGITVWTDKEIEFCLFGFITIYHRCNRCRCHIRSGRSVAVANS